MKRLPLLALLLLPGLAAANPEGQSAFNNTCASCHTLTPQPSKSALKAQKAGHARVTTPARSPLERRVEIGKLVKERSSAELRTWITAPSEVKKETRCDTRGMNPTDLDALVAYLKTSSRPPPLSRDDQLRQQLQNDLAARRAKQRLEARESSRPEQGKK
ncbi:cytochrome c family protein [Myxococcus sp. CA039A]|uniref:c-type cytochrome n=1 Tax=Myxococcus sp. CA039A TaxID=2741737 RepID=UPI00157AACFA|nr:c-type cytochrome [Myxococcus sp. CA039A]NTX54975.1 c-type cytochrome [Myxococcus sp. CA039A]